MQYNKVNFKKFKLLKLQLFRLSLLKGFKIGVIHNLKTIIY